MLERVRERVYGECGGECAVCMESVKCEEDVAVFIISKLYFHTTRMTAFICWILRDSSHLRLPCCKFYIFR